MCEYLLALKIEFFSWRGLKLANYCKEGKNLSDLSEEKLKKALLKKALGYIAKEQVCEYSIDENGDEVLSKKKVTKKQLSPDLSALKILLEKFYGDFSVEKMSDEELEKEKSRLLQLLKEEEENANRKMQETDQM